MSFIAKTAPVHLDAHNRCVVIAPPAGLAAPRVGDVIYLWFSETQGGSGLAHRGEILAVGDSVPLEVAVRVHETCALGSLSKSHLQAFATAPAGSGERGLWAKLYGHSHNKVVALDLAETGVLDAHFPTNDKSAPPIEPTAPKREPDLAKAFEAAMREIYNRAVSECSYHPTYFLQMVNERGGVGAAHALIAGKPSDGFTKLWELGRLDLSVEAMILDKRWRSLFSDVERGVAHRRLRSAGYEAQ